MSMGAILSKASLRSKIAPSSYSIVVKPAVDPVTKACKIPEVIFDSSSTETTASVISRMSVKPFVLITNVPWWKCPI